MGTQLKDYMERYGGVGMQSAPGDEEPVAEAQPKQGNRSRLGELMERYGGKPSASTITPGVKRTTPSPMLLKMQIDKINSQILPLQQQAEQLTQKIQKDNTDPNKIIYGARITDMDSITRLKKTKQELESLNARKWRLEQEQRYANLSQNEDFSEKSAVDVENRDAAYRYINDVDDSRKWEDAHGTMRGGSKFSKYTHMTQEEISTYNYLYSTQGKQAAKEYLSYLDYTINERVTESSRATVAKNAAEHPILTNTMSVPANLISGVGLLDAAAQKAYKDIAGAVTGEYTGPIDYNRPTMGLTNFVNIVRGTTAQRIADQTGTIQLDETKNPVLAKIFNGKGLADVYQLGMSMADSLAVGYLTPFGEAGAVLLGGSAGTQGVLDAVAKGATEDQALTMGMLNGAFEALFEYVSLDKLLNGDTKGIVRAFLEQGFVEGTEEFNTTLANTIADICVMAEKSDYQKSIAEYEEQGYSEKQAQRMAMSDIAIQMGWDFVGGALSGGIMGGGKGAYDQMFPESHYYTKTYEDNLPDLVRRSNEMNPGNPLASKMQERMNAGKRVSWKQIQRLVAQNEADFRAHDISVITDAASDRLTQYGETGDLNTISSAVAKLTIGERLTSDEKKSLKKSRYWKHVINEINPANIDAGWDNTGLTHEHSTKMETQNVIQNELQSHENSSTQTKLAQSSLDNREDQIRPMEIGIDTDTLETTHPVENQQEEQAATKILPEKEELSIQTGLLEASQKYGDQADAFTRTYQDGQDVSRYDSAFRTAYDAGRAGVPIQSFKSMKSVAYLTQEQAQTAYQTGAIAARASAEAQIAENLRRQNHGKTGWKKGTVKGDGVTIADLKATFNDQQGRAYRTISTIAEATGVDVVLYQSAPDADGNYQGTQGRFSWENDKIYVDINAGVLRGADVSDLGKYAMLRTFTHEFTHFIEKWSPAQYQTLRSVVFQELEKRGENVPDLIEGKQSMDRSGQLDFEMASREVVAEAMTDILPDSSFVQNLAQKQQNIFEKLLERLKEFTQKIRDYFDSIGANRSKEANALKRQAQDTLHYLDSIVDAFDRAALDATEQYQQANPSTAQDKASPDSAGTKNQSRAYLSHEAFDFQEEIDAWERSGLPDGATFVLGSTGSVLQGLGAIENDIYLRGDKIKKIYQDHPEMTAREIKSIPEILENPVLVLASRNINRGNQVNTRLTIFGMVKARNNLPVMVVFDLNPTERNLSLRDMQKVSSAYTKDNSPNAAMRLIEKSQILYADKEKAASLLHSIGFRYAYRIEQGDFIGSISYEDDQVKISGRKFTDVFAQRERKIQEQNRVSPMTDREVLAIAAEEIALSTLSAAERDALTIFQNRLQELQGLEEDQKQLKEQYQTQRASQNQDLEQMEKTRSRIRVLSNIIQKKSADLLDTQNKTILKRVLQKARVVVEGNEQARARETLSRYRDRTRNAAAVKKYKQSIAHEVDTLSKWISNPSNKNAYQHVPDAVKNSVIPFLTSIDFTSRRQLGGGKATQTDARFVEQMEKIKAALKQHQDIAGIYSGYMDLPVGFLEKFQDLIDQVKHLTQIGGESFVINRMTAEELKKLNSVVKNLKRLITEMNVFHKNAIFHHASDAGENSISFLRELGDAKNAGKASEFLLWQQMRPAYAFERFGKGGISIYDEFRAGQATLAFHTREIIDFSKKAYTDSEVREWEKEIKTFDLSDGSVQIPVSHLMSLYLLSKRDQALGHILGGGIRVATFRDGKNKISDVGRQITQQELNSMLDALTPRQKEVADKLQGFMARQGGEWGNYVSVARFGEALFGEENYFPINSDGRYLEASAAERPSAASLYALLNMGFTKETRKNANNRLILYSCFDVFANHMASMAQYNAFALPILDSLKWLNYQKTETVIGENGKESSKPTDSVRQQMARVYGVPEENRPGSGKSGYAETFVKNIIRAFNGTEAQGIPSDTSGIQAMHRYNVAQVAFNLRVVAQQPLAITRAGMILDYKSILRGLKLSPSAIKQNISEMQTYSGIAAWKDLGFYDVNISRGLTDIIKHKSSMMDKIDEVGMLGAEKADQLTWAAMWSASKEQIQKRGVKPTDPNFYDQVTKLFEEVIYKTQVVDSVLTKNEFLRSKGAWARLVGSFMSEPTTTASMLLDAYDKYAADKARGISPQQAWQRNRKNIVRTAYVYAIGNVMLAAVTAVCDAWRDDDDYMTFAEKWLDAFSGNLIDESMPLNKLPILRDVYEAAKSLLDAWGFDTYGNEPRSVIFQWRDQLVKANQIFHDKITGKTTNYTWYGGAYKLLQAISGMSGLPMGAATREIVSAWNNSVGTMAPSLKLKTYALSPKTSVKYAYLDGYLTQKEAIDALVDGGEVDENEAYWTVQGWKTGESSKYSNLYQAMQTGDGVQEALQELTSHGVEMDEASTRMKSKIGDWYKGTEDVPASITAQQAKDMLCTYCDMTKEEAQQRVQAWTAKKETGINLSDIGSALESGSISQKEAERMLAEYGGKTDQEAHAKAQAIVLAEQYPGWDGIARAVTRYQSYGASAGMSEADYIDAVYHCDQCQGTDEDGDGNTDPGSLQAQRWSYIDSLPISKEQKDALHLAFYKESTLKNTPWNS